MFSNLIGNSLKYARSDVPPRVKITSHAADGWIDFSISDNGIGIDPRYAEQIFKPMQRLHGPQSEFEGFGLGLSLVQAIIEGHGGSIRLDTEFEDGARFVFRLPDQTAKDSVLV